MNVGNERAGQRVAEAALDVMILARASIAIRCEEQPLIFLTCSVPTLLTDY
jgi:hypothetical protein